MLGMIQDKIQSIYLKINQPHDSVSISLQQKICNHTEKWSLRISNMFHINDMANDCSK